MLSLILAAFLGLMFYEGFIVVLSVNLAGRWSVFMCTKEKTQEFKLSISNIPVKGILEPFLWGSISFCSFPHGLGTAKQIFIRMNCTHSSCHKKN